ncbi:HEPN domain-containing protein [Chitinophagaceae bacterium 26-R-25]|nr:HEPN domain-containing protein [Chitinophagaceae bacterium 26-R-25]
MKPFALYHTFTEHFTIGEQKLLQMILEMVNANAVYLLGASLNGRRTESVFSPSSPSAQRISEYFLLVIMGGPNNKPLYEWQDKIEQHLRPFATVTVIVLETITFQQWLNDCHPFAVTVAATSVPIFKKEGIQFALPTTVQINQQKLQGYFREGIEKTRSFFAGAELYMVRKEYKMAAFMLHQATEQALVTLVKTGTGYHSHTHNIERLLRYASMISYQLPDIFPRHTDQEKQLFKLLQNAYSDARYAELYIIGYKELHLLIGRVKEIIAVAEGFEKKIFYN